MQPGNATLRLEAHRLKWIRSNRRIPLLQFHELTEHEKQFFIEELTRDVSVRRLQMDQSADATMFDRMLLDILNEWGIMCPHPVSSVTQVPRGYNCDICGCHVVVFKNNKRPLSDKIKK
jgi:hypothetical protein